MKIAFFDTHPFEKEYFERINEIFQHEITYLGVKLNDETVRLAFGFEGVCVFVNDDLNADVLRALHVAGVRLVAIRATGFNNIDLVAAEALGLRVVRVPEYSPHAVAEFALGLILSLDRKIHRAHQRVREGNFSLEGLVGFDLFQKTVGIIGTGRIGSVLAKILNGMGCEILANDLRQNPELLALSGLRYAELDEIYEKSDIISLHVPLTPQTRHLLNEEAFAKMKKGVMVINTGRGALIDTHALIDALKSGSVGNAGLDVYEEEDKVFFKDLSETVLEDDVIARLITFPNVLLTSHQGFLTQEALEIIARSTLQNVSDFESGAPLVNELLPQAVLKRVA